MNDTSGLMSPIPFAYFDPDTCSVRTSQLTFELDSTKSSPILPKRGSMRNGELFERPMSERHIDGNGSSSLLPTPTASQPGGTPEQHLERKRGGKMNRANPTVTDLRMALQLLPTPTARDWKDGKYCANVDERALLGRAVWKLLPTPKATNNENQQTPGKYGPNLGMALRDSASTEPPLTDGNESPDE